MNEKAEIIGVAFAIVCYSGLCAFSQVLPTGGVSPVRKVDASTRSNFLVRTGGFIQAPSKGPVVRIVNTQQRVGLDTIAETVGRIKPTFRHGFILSTGPDPKDAVVLAKEVLKMPDTASVVLIIDKPEQATMLVAPEDRWAILNVARLAEGGVTSDVLKQRAIKELWRTYGYLMGAAYTSSDMCVMRPVFKPVDLDVLKLLTLGLDAIVKIEQSMQAYGITPERTTTYRKACEEGWAPMPTNQLQRAVWEDVKANKK